MFLETVVPVFLIYSFIVGVYICIPTLVALFVYPYLVPKYMVERYLRPPYYHEHDDIRFQHIPFRTALTLSLIVFTVFHGRARRRGLPQEFHGDCPRYWRILAHFFILVFATPAFAFTLSMPIFLIYGWLDLPMVLPDWVPRGADKMPA